MNIVIHGLAYLSLLICVRLPFSRAQQTFFPSSVPLFFRSPYFYAYIPTTSGTIHSHEWPRITGPVSSLGWTCLIKVDNGTTYLWSGDTDTVPRTNDTVVKYFTVTPTRTIFTIQAGPLELNITYLSPIEPDDLVKQSIPFVYLAFEARSTDGSPHHMQVYTGVTGEWLSPDHTQNHTWATTSTTNGSQIHSFSYSSPQEFNEDNGMASWGTPYYATRQGAGVTYRIGMAEPSPSLFLSQGSLDNSVDQGAPRIIKGGNLDFTSLTFAHDLGTIESTSAPIVWAFGHTFDSDNTSAIQYQDLSGNPPQRRSLYYVTQYSDDYTLIDDFLNDFPAALERAIKLDANLTNAAASTISGTEYSDLIALATRQALGFTSLTIAKGSDGSWNKSDVMMFWRDLGIAAPDPVNTPDGLYSSFPMYLYLNPAFGAPLLEPLLRFQASPAYTKSIPYAAANIGTSWPNMTASNSSHHQGVEQSANMIILSYAQARAAGDTSLVGRYYLLLKSWADYLVNTAPFTPSTTTLSDIQISADGLNIANQTNLAIKGIIAIKAMSMIASLTGNTADATAYSDKSRDLFTQWKAHALAADDRHMLLAYDDDDSSNYSLGYNVFADLWLGTGVVDSDVTNGLSNQANKLLSSPVIQPGLPTDSTVTDRVQSAWNMFIAAAVNNSATRSRIISRVHDRISLNTTDDQLYPLTWSSSSFSTIFGDTSPRQGAVFAPLALSGVGPRAPTSPAGNGTTPAGGGTSNASSHPHTAAIAGGVVGGVLGSVVLVGLALWFWRRYKRTRLAYSSGNASVQSIPDPEPFTMQDANSPSTPTGSPTVLSPKGLLALRHTTRLTHAVSTAQVPDVRPPVMAPSREHVILDPRVDELRREMDVLRLRAERAEPPPSYVDE